MKKIGNVILLFVVFLLFTALVGLYRSYIDKIALLIALDIVLKNILSGIWILLQSPIIQTGLLLVFGIWLIRDYLPKILSSITEVKAGEFSAKLDTKKLLVEEINKEAVTEAEFEKSEDKEKRDNDLINNTPDKQTGFDMFEETDKNDAGFVYDLFQKIPDEICWYLIKVHGKSITFDEHLRILESEGVVQKMEASNRSVVGIGYLYAVLSIFGDVLFVILKDPENKSNLRLALKARPLVLIKQKLNID